MIGGDSLPSCSITSHLLMQPETCITRELNNIFLSIHDRKICGSKGSHFVD